MIDALLTGRLAAAPEARTASNGSRYALARVLVTTGGEDRLAVSVIAFDATTVAGLLALTQGEAVTLAGELTPKVWTDKDDNAQPSAGLKAHALLTPYHVTRKRQAMAMAMAEAGGRGELQHGEPARGRHWTGGLPAQISGGTAAARKRRRLLRVSGWRELQHKEPARGRRWAAGTPPENRTEQAGYRALLAVTLAVTFNSNA